MSAAETKLSEAEREGRFLREMLQNKVPQSLRLTPENSDSESTVAHDWLYALERKNRGESSVM